MKTLVIALLLCAFLVASSNVMAGGAGYAQVWQRARELQAEQKRLDDSLAKIGAEADRAFVDVTTTANPQPVPRRAVAPNTRLCLAACPVTK